LVVLSALAVSVGCTGGQATEEWKLLAGPWATPHELRTLHAFSNASFAQKQAILAGAATRPVDLPNGGTLHESLAWGPPGEQDLRRGVVYQASSFPLAIRLRPPDDRWGGVQIQSGRFGFVQLHHLRTGNVPLHGWGFMTIETGTGPTASVETIVRRLHATQQIEAGPITPARVAGFPGKRFDATIVGTDRPKPRGISLAPFTPNRRCGFCTKTMKGETQDHKYVGTDELLRVIVVDVRGKTVVIYLESASGSQAGFPAAKTFPTFLPYAREMLSTLTFPR
jgi:hypothetical protein